MSRSRFAALAAALLFAGFQQSVPSIAAHTEPKAPLTSAINGYNVGGVYYRCNGALDCFFVQEHDAEEEGRWAERSLDGTFYFIEQYRDDRSVFLYDASRGISVQLDLHVCEIFIRVGQDPYQYLYDIELVQQGLDDVMVAC